MEDLPLKKRMRLQLDPEPAVVQLDPEPAVVQLDPEPAVVQDAGDDNAQGDDDNPPADEENPVELDENPPVLSCIHESVRRYLTTCALLGCNLRVSPESDYCCHGHQELAGVFSQQPSAAFQSFDRFLDRQTTCSISLLNICRNVETGIPNLDSCENLFTTVPWDLPILVEDAVEGIFRGTPPSSFTNMKDGQGNQLSIRWKSMPMPVLRIPGVEHPEILFKLYNIYDAGGDAADDIKILAKEWALRLFQCQSHSLYCLSRGKEKLPPEPRAKGKRCNRKTPTPSGSSLPQSESLPKDAATKDADVATGDNLGGKSSQVPQLLLGANMAPILCTQPRRFAVVAVAKMVTNSRNSDLGGEVGYHIGHSKILTDGSKILFKTAGVLLDEMLDKGLNALKYKVIILDEVHERSVESDLVRVCIKQFLMKNSDLRVVLMSATADIARYRDYFKELGRGERVEVIAVPSPDQRRVLYLEQIAGLSDVTSDLSAYCPGPSPSSAATEIKPKLQNLIQEPDIEKSILVFLPTYYSLEQQWYQLEPFRASFEVHILHRSIDTEQALAAMKVILATNIAESSVTIPKVACVIDSCRSLQVFWDPSRKRDAVQLVWVSRSQAEQRRGRTGRTCDGEVYRLVPSAFFNRLEEHEPPAILKLSLRQQVLPICCTESRAINDANALLAKAMDPPNADVIDDAFTMLLSTQALRKSPRGRYEPTLYGRLLASFPLSFGASILAVKFGEMGMLREGILLRVLMHTQPLPISHPFGADSLFLEYVDHYFGGDSSKTVSGSRREVVLMANLCAFQIWLKDKHRPENLKQVLAKKKDKDLKSKFPEIEQEWCDFHNVVRSSFYHVSEMYEDTLGSFHRFRPQFINASDSLLEVRKCVSVPYVPPNAFQANAVAKYMANIMKEIRTQSENGYGAIEPKDYAEDGEVPVCVYFLNGSCNRGDQCTFSHTLEESLQGCRNGELCLYSHLMPRQTTSYSSPPPCLPEEDDSSTSLLVDLFHNITFSHLQVEKLSRDSFFFLGESFPHNSISFSDTSTTQKPMLVSRPISYVFDHHPPTDIQFGDYASILHNQ